MKASMYDRIRTLVDVDEGFRRDRRIPAGSEGCVVERYSDPEEGYAVDLEMPDESLVGGVSFANVILKPEQFEVIPTT